MPIIPGEVCIGSATFFSFVAVLLLIFTHVGQLNTSTIPRGISMVKMNVSGFGDALSQSHAGDSAAGLYTTNATAPLEEGDGLRQIYAWGFYSHCAYVAPEQGICSNKSQPNLFQPFDTMVADAPAKFHTVTQFIVPNSGFTDSSFLGSLSRGAYWLCFIGSILAALAMIL
ncbi:hypothetical protein SISNIDRAFT_72822 [Sistotremastrum niveocremeum HHB9708]|uniref:Uncharacterized protein n=1 Tax=Sistotremastrum niveocremeum HHB9708 TaxID=1314777 RepID=A0A164UHH8_9AGAM|nr:hypothetical protein SISNIDRAFT_72822 [Sistotremastrum niveocremeum HHB9708]